MRSQKENKQVEPFNQILEFTIKTINSRLPFRNGGELGTDEETTIGSDFLSRWLVVRHSDPLGLPTRIIVTALSSNMFAESDTTTITMRLAIYHLCKKPSAMERLVKKIDRAEDKSSNPIKYQEASNYLPHLNAAIKEAMRICPGI